MSRALNEEMEKHGIEVRPNISRRDRRIYLANVVASTDTSKFDKLIEWAKVHPYMMTDIMKGYVTSPDDRFGDTLLIFCSLIMSGEIKLDYLNPNWLRENK